MLSDLDGQVCNLNVLSKASAILFTHLSISTAFHQNIVDSHSMMLG